MNDKPKDPGWIDGNLFNRNRSKFTYEELLPCAGQHVAWSRDGTKIIAHHEDVEELVRMVEAMGLDTTDVVFSWEPPAGVDTLLL